MSASSVKNKEISLGLLKDLVIQFLVTNNFVHDDEEIINFKFHFETNGVPIPLSGYDDRKISMSYDIVKKRENNIYKYHGKET